MGVFVYKGGGDSPLQQCDKNFHMHYCNAHTYVSMYAYVHMYNMCINVCMWPRRKCRNLLCGFNKKLLCRYRTGWRCVDVIEIYCVDTVQGGVES